MAISHLQSSNIIIKKQKRVNTRWSNIPIFGQTRVFSFFIVYGNCGNLLSQVIYQGSAFLELYLRLLSPFQNQEGEEEFFIFSLSQLSRHNVFGTLFNIQTNPKSHKNVTTFELRYLPLAKIPSQSSIWNKFVTCSRNQLWEQLYTVFRF